MIFLLTLGLATSEVIVEDCVTQLDPTGRLLEDWEGISLLTGGVSNELRSWKKPLLVSKENNASSCPWSLFLDAVKYLASARKSFLSDRSTCKRSYHNLRSSNSSCGANVIARMRVSEFLQEKCFFFLQAYQIKEALSSRSSRRFSLPVNWTTDCMSSL